MIIWRWWSFKEKSTLTRHPKVLAGEGTTARCERQSTWGCSGLPTHGRPLGARGRLSEGPRKEKHDERVNLDNGFVGTCTFRTRHGQTDFGYRNADALGRELTRMTGCAPVPSGSARGLPSLVCETRMRAPQFPAISFPPGLPCFFTVSLPSFSFFGRVVTLCLHMCPVSYWCCPVGRRPPAHQQACPREHCCDWLVQSWIHSFNECF